MTRASILATFAVFFAGVANAQIAEPIRPPMVITTPTVIAPTVQPLPMTPTLPLPQAAPTVTPALPVQVVPPPPEAAESDTPDGSDSCDCYVTEDVPVYENGVQVGSNRVSRYTGKSPQCCPDH
jgi:hypothetical protein